MTMRILMVHKYFHRRDGVGTYAHQLTQLLQGAGHTVAPFAMHDPRNDRSPWEYFFVSSGETARIAWGRGAWKQLRRAYWHTETAERFAAMLDAFAPDVIHVHNWYTHLSPSFLRVASDRGIPVVMTAHDFGFLTADYGLVGGWRYIKQSVLATVISEAVARWHHIRGNNLRGIRAVICLSNYVAQVCRSRGVPEEHLHVVPPPLISLPQHQPVAARNGVAFIGRWEAYKGLRMVIAMAQALPNVPFWVMGDGPLRQELHRAAERTSNVHVLGWTPQVEAYERLEQALVAVVPSQWAEPYGLVALEAQAAGAVTLVSDRGGLPEVVEHGRTGFVLPAENVEAWVKKIADLHSAPDKCARLSGAARERANALGNPQVFLATMLDIYTEVCQQEPLALRSISKW